MKHKLGILQTHPIQYFSPWYRALAAHPEIELTVYYAHQQSPQGQSDAGFGVPFEWDQPLLDGYPYKFLKNLANRPGTDHFLGCHTPEIAEIIRRETFDAFLVSGWYVRSFWQAIRACWTTGTPIFIRGDSQLPTTRSIGLRLLKEPVYRWFIPKFDRYLLVGQRAKEYFLHFGASESRMFPVPHAVDNRFFAEAANSLQKERMRLRQEWGIPRDAVVFLFAGKLVARKRPKDFLKAIKLAAAGSSGAFGLIAGDGPLRQELEASARADHLPVQFTGFLNQSELPKAYAASDVLVLPSDGSETWGLVVNEAMASGLPAIVSDAVGCGPDLILPDQTGEVFPMGDYKSLGIIMKQLINDPEKRNCLSAGARRHITGYSIERAVEGVLDALKSLPLRRR
jgi:glycosyltransferase involved in cell wall biosynthesis